ncbi:MAG: adenylyltransferase/cytidyltransferase family protein [Bacteroidales bacterium]|nr:adenylyltransferase/cytidyltransferase family protein [Bacteroidales bacterium]
MKKYSIGYTQGVFDMFHVGHLNILLRAKELCESLVVGVNADALVMDYKMKRPVIPESDRMRIVESVKYVDKVLLAQTLDKEAMWHLVGFNALFIGSDWKGSERWTETALRMSEHGVDTVFPSHTDGISSSMLRTLINI